MKPQIRNEYRFAFRAGELVDIPADVLTLLRTHYKQEEGCEKKKVKEAPGSQQPKGTEPKGGELE